MIHLQQSRGYASGGSRYDGNGRFPLQPPLMMLFRTKMASCLCSPQQRRLQSGLHWLVNGERRHRRHGSLRQLGSQVSSSGGEERPVLRLAAGPGSGTGSSGFRTPRQETGQFASACTSFLLLVLNTQPRLGFQEPSITQSFSWVHGSGAGNLDSLNKAVFYLKKKASLPTVPVMKELMST